MNSQTKTHAITRRFPVLLLAAALVALAVLFAHSALPVFAQQSSASLTLSAASSTVAETAGSATVTVTLDQPAGEGGATVTLLANPSDAGTAAQGRDYSLRDARATIAGGGTEASIRVTIKDDAVNEPDETIILTASCQCNVATVSANTVTVTIQDNEQDVRDPVETHSYWARLNPQNLRVEPAGSSLVVTFVGYSRGEAWLRWREDSNPKWTTVKNVRSGHILEDLANGVLHHVEVISVSGHLRGNWASTTATPSPQGDPPSGPSEMTLSVLGGADSFGEDAGIVTVLARVYGTAPEGGVTVTLDSLDGSPATAVEGRDYNLPGSFTIAEGRSEASVNFSIANDAVNEPDETIYLSATTDSSSITTVAGLILTIRDDEPDLSPQGFVRMEKPTNLTLTPGNGYIDVDFGRPDGNVYEYWLQWRADDNPQWTTVRGGRITQINIYSKRHTDDWNIYGLVNGVVHHVRVANVENPYSGFQQWSGWVEASATPTDNLTLSVASSTVAETAGSVTVTATLAQPAPTGGVQVTLTPKSSDAGTAALGRDYTLPYTFTIARGDTTAEAQVIINDDAVNERDETINLTATLGNAGATTVTGVTITIQDNEESRSPPGSGSFSGYEPENVKATPGHEALTITFDRAVLSSLTFWLQWRADDNPEWTTVTPVSSGHTIGNLANGVLHHVRVTGDDGQHRGGWVSTSATPNVSVGGL